MSAMRRRTGARLFVAGLLALVIAALPNAPAGAEKTGGILRVYDIDTPPSASLLEESTNSATIAYSDVSWCGRSTAVCRPRAPGR